MHTVTVLIVIFLAGGLLVGYVWRNLGNKKIVNLDIPSGAIYAEGVGTAGVVFWAIENATAGCFSDACGLFSADDQNIG